MAMQGKTGKGQVEVKDETPASSLQEIKSSEASTGSGNGQSAPFTGSPGLEGFHSVISFQDKLRADLVKDSVERSSGFVPMSHVEKALVFHERTPEDLLDTSRANGDTRYLPPGIAMNPYAFGLGTVISRSEAEAFKAMLQGQDLVRAKQWIENAINKVAPVDISSVVLADAPAEPAAPSSPGCRQ